MSHSSQGGVCPHALASGFTPAALGKPTPRGENYQPCEQADRDATGGTAVLQGAAPLLGIVDLKRYLGYAGRTVRMEYRLTDGQDSAWANWFLDSAQTDDRGFVELFDLISAEEEGPGGVLLTTVRLAVERLSFAATTAATEPAQAMVHRRRDSRCNDRLGAMSSDGCADRGGRLIVT